MIFFRDEAIESRPEVFKDVVDFSGSLIVRVQMEICGRLASAVADEGCEG